jgi:hypothetical protein
MILYFGWDCGISSEPLQFIYTKVIMLGARRLSTSYLVHLALFVCEVISSSIPSNNAPTVTVRNGTLRGVYSREYDQDFFLGIPYAQPPLNNLRFNLPHSLNSAWHGVKDAVEYSPECVGYGASITIP